MQTVYEGTLRVPVTVKADEKEEKDELSVEKEILKSHLRLRNVTTIGLLWQICTDGRFTLTPATRTRTRTPREGASLCDEPHLRATVSKRGGAKEPDRT